MSRQRRRLLSNAAARLVMRSLAVIALVPLALVLAYTVLRGFSPVSHLTFFLNNEGYVGSVNPGVANAIVGTLVMVGMASVFAVPAGVLAGVHLVEFAAGRGLTVVRLATDVLVATPSIVLGLFAYEMVVAPLHRFSAVSGSFALAILMIPVVVRTTEGAMALVPGGLREAGLALGLPRWRVALQLVLPAAAPGVITGALLAVARAAGETAPLLFTGFGNSLFNLNPGTPMSALPLVVFHDALTPYPSLQEQAWGAALILVVLVLLTNVGSRLALRRQIALAGGR